MIMFYPSDVKGDLEKTDNCIKTVSILRSEMLPGINWVTGMWVQRHCLLRECPGGAEVCTPRPL